MHGSIACFVKIRYIPQKTLIQTPPDMTHPQNNKKKITTKRPMGHIAVVELLFLVTLYFVAFCISILNFEHLMRPQYCSVVLVGFNNIESTLS